MEIDHSSGTLHVILFCLFDKGGSAVDKKTNAWNDEYLLISNLISIEKKVQWKILW